MKYIVITEEFAQANKDFKKGSSSFGYTKTRDGRLVCSENSYNEFPELWTKKPQTVDLEHDDFEMQTPMETMSRENVETGEEPEEKIPKQKAKAKAKTTKKPK